MSRKYIDWIFWIGFLVAIAAIVHFNPELLGVQAWAKFIWVVSSLLLVPALFYLLVRTIFRKAFPERIRIRPFTPLHDKSTYNGSAIARLLELEMQPPVPSKEARSRVRSERRVRSLNISLGGTTIPLEFIWGSIDRWVLGPIYTIEGIVSESDGGIIIEAWSTERGFRWRAKSSSHPESDPLRTAIHSLTDQVRESFSHYQELTVKFEAQHRYESAIYLCQRLDKAEQGTTLAYLYLYAGRLEEAELAFKALENNEKEEVRWEALRGLALVRTARGEYSEAIGILKKVRGDLEMRSKLDEATVLCYQGDFETARENLENLAPHIESSLQSVLRVKRPGLAVDVLESKLSNLKEKEWIKVYNDLWNLAELYGSLGRRSEELNDSEQSEQSYRSAVEVLTQLSVISGAYHQIALDQGGRLEDLAEYDEAMMSYDDCLRDAKDHYREDSEDVSALTNIAWATAGNLGCLVKKLDLALNAFDSPETSRRVLEDAEQLTRLFQNVPEELWQAVVIEAVNQYRLVGEQGEEVMQPIGPLRKEDVEELLRVLADLGQVTGGLDLQVLFNFVSWIVHRNKNDQSAQDYFWQLAQKPAACHAAEGYFGLACVDAICYRYERALGYLEFAIAYTPEFKNRARLDQDLRVLHDNETFQQLVQWDASSITSDQ